MGALTIVLNPQHPAYPELSRSVAETLDDFESISYRKENKTVEPGTLAIGLNEVAAFVVSHHDKILEIAGPLLSALSNLIRWSSASSSKDKKDPPPMVVIVDNKPIQFPATDHAQKRYLRQLQNGTADKSVRKKAKRVIRRQEHKSKKRKGR